MAVYYKWIKGCSDDTTSTTDGKWNYIKWGDLPKIYTTVGKNNNPSDEEDCLGNIVTDNYGHIMQKLISFNAGLKIGDATLSFHPEKKVVESTKGFDVDGDTKMTGSCHATYFNATSDRRAKENITPSTYNALNTIINTPVMDYNYINNSDRVTGIIAQDLLKTQPEGLNLVSGSEEEMLSIKTDKIMFIMWKAIQEQQEQIRDLQNQINELKNK